MFSKKLCFSKCLLLWVLFAGCIFGISCQNVSFDQPINECLAKFNMSDERDIDYFQKFGKFLKGKEHEKCVFGCIFNTSEVLNSKSDFNETNLKDFVTHLVEKSDGKIDVNVVELFDLLSDKCLSSSHLSSTCETALSFMTCYQDVLTTYHMYSYIRNSDNTTEASLNETYSENKAAALHYCKRISDTPASHTSSFKSPWVISISVVVLVVILVVLCLVFYVRKCKE